MFTAVQISSQLATWVSTPRCNSTKGCPIVSSAVCSSSSCCCCKNASTAAADTSSTLQLWMLYAAGGDGAGPLLPCARAVREGCNCCSSSQFTNTCRMVHTNDWFECVSTNLPHAHDMQNCLHAVVIQHLRQRTCMQTCSLQLDCLRHHRSGRSQ